MVPSEESRRKPGPRSTFDSLREARGRFPASVSAGVEPVASVSGADGVSHVDRSKIWWVALAFLILPAVAAVVIAVVLIEATPEEGTSFEAAAAMFIVLLVAVPVGLVALLAFRFSVLAGISELVAGVPLFVIFLGGLSDLLTAPTVTEQRLGTFAGEDSQPSVGEVVALGFVSIPVLVSGALFVIDFAWPRTTTAS